jgi:hypothetical protein
MNPHKLFPFLFLIFLFTFAAPPHNFAAEKQAANEETLLEGVTPDQADSVIAKMSDEQVRSLLVAELSKDFTKVDDKEQTDGGLVLKATGLLHLLDEDKNKLKSATISLSSMARVPFDYVEIARKIGNGSLGRSSLYCKL